MQVGLSSSDSILYFRLRELDQPLEHFDERLWLEVIDHVIVQRDEKLVFMFQNGTKVRV